MSGRDTNVTGTKGVDNTGDFFKHSQVTNAETEETQGMIKYAVDVEESKKLKIIKNGGSQEC